MHWSDIVHFSKKNIQNFVKVITHYDYDTSLCTGPKLYTHFTHFPSPNYTLPQQGSAKITKLCRYIGLVCAIHVMRGIQLNKNFSHVSYPVLTTTQNDEKFSHFWFQFFRHPFYMGISYMKRHVQMRWMYLNMSYRTLEWEHVVKLRNIWLLITSLILIITQPCCTSRQWPRSSMAWCYSWLMRWLGSLSFMPWLFWGAMFAFPFVCFAWRTLELMSLIKRRWWSW